MAGYLPVVAHNEVVRMFCRPARARGGGGGSRTCDCCHVVMAALRILPPFLVLSLCYCLWFVFMRFFNDLYRVNAWGFNAYDQVPSVTGTVTMLRISFYVCRSPCRRSCSLSWRC